MNYAAIADELAQLADVIGDALARADRLLHGTGPIREHARPWLSHLDRSTGIERTCTIEDTVAELRAAAAMGAV